MTRLMTALTAAMLCGPFAANAAITSAPKPANTVTSAAHSDAAYQVARLDGQVMNLNGEVQALLQQANPGTAYVSELSGVIPTGG
jgi:hypothetical protein